MAKRQSDQVSRAEKVRARRKQTRKPISKTPLGSSATRKQTKNNAPVTRRSTPRVPVVNRKKNRMHIPLKNRGAEIQLPGLPRFQPGWQLVSGAIFVISLVVVISLSGLEMFQVKTIDLKGAERLGVEAILSQADLSGNSIISIRPSEIEEQVLENFPSLSRVNVTVGLPASVMIRVVERQPLILWEQPESLLWIDTEGVMFPIRGEAEVQLRVLASGNPPGPPQDLPQEEEELLLLLQNPTYPTTTPDFVQAVVSFKDFLPEGSDLQYDPRFGLGWIDPNGWLVYFGKDTTNIDIKLAEYETILTALEKRQVTPALISLEFMHAPFYRLEH